MSRRRTAGPGRMAAAALAAAALLLVPARSAADESADETCPEEPTIRVHVTGLPPVESPRLSGLHVYLAPGVIHVPLDGDDDPGYQWGLGAGYLFRPADNAFALAAGIGLEHSIGNPPDMPGGADISSHQVRVEARAQPGAVLLDESLFVFGDVGFGYAVWPWSSTAGTMTTSNTSHGVVLSLGAGALYKVWEGLAVGGGFGFDLQWFFANGQTTASHNFDLAVLAGWFF